MTAPATSSSSVPVYERKELPEQLKHLRTMTELKAVRLKLADGQEPVAMVRVYRRGHGWGEFPLYDPAQAAKMRPLSAKQQAAKTARRTCPECQQVRDYVVYQRCEDCRGRAQKEAQDRQARTCHRCRREAGAALLKDVHGWSACPHCRIQFGLRAQAEKERAAAWRRTCPGRDCEVVTATDEEIDAAWAAGGWSGPRWCPPCKERDELERAAYRQAAEEARRRQVAELVAWAQGLLADPDTVVLDTETTGLHDTARIIDLGILHISGRTLMDRLLDPGEPIPAEATDIHGLADDDLRGAPTFGSIVDELAAVLAGKRVLIYNEAYDVGRLRHELQLHYTQSGHPDPVAAATAWLEAVRFEDVMIPYSDWYGDWSDYWGNYAWQPLYGGDHRALSDCRAVVERLREMAG